MYESQQAFDASETPTYKTGTTTIGIVAEDGVVLATDRRASLGGQFVSNKNVVKVEQVHPTAAVTIAGSVGGAQAFIRSLRAEAALYETRRDKRLTIPALSRLAGDVIVGMAVSPLLGGYDTEGHLFQIDAAGGVLEETYAATGSGMTVAYGVLEREYEEGMSVDDARDLAIAAVRAASERDTASGNGVVTATITEDGVEIEEVED
jgi:proteasome beta subunit